jgi:hypothetical protein
MSDDKTPTELNRVTAGQGREEAEDLRKEADHERGNAEEHRAVAESSRTEPNSFGCSPMRPENFVNDVARRRSQFARSGRRFRTLLRMRDKQRKRRATLPLRRSLPQLTR